MLPANGSTLILAVSRFALRAMLYIGVAECWRSEQRLGPCSSRLEIHRYGVSVSFGIVSG